MNTKKSSPNRIARKIVPILILAILVSLLAGIPTVSAAESSLGNVIGASVSGSKVTLTVDNGTEASDDLLTVEVCQENILRVDFQPNSVQVSPDTPIIDPDLSWTLVDATIQIAGDPITIQTSDMLIEIARTPCRMTVKKADGTALFWEPASGGVFNDGVRFVRAEATNMYGIHSFDCFSDNGNLLRNDNTNTATAGQQGNSGGPFMWSTAGYGLLVDSDGGYPYTNASDKKMEFYYGGTPAEGRRYVKNDVEYYIMLGSPTEIMTAFSKITGTSPMMPKWSLGFSNFEWGINENELNQMVDTYRAKNIPIDGYAFDYDWKDYGEDNYGEFRWNTDNFPSASSNALQQTMSAKGIKMIGITKPRIVTTLEDGTQTQQGAYAQNHGFYYPGHYSYLDYFVPVTVQSIDPYQAAQRTWWWEHSQDAFDKGIVGWWNDETDKVSSNGAEYLFGNYTTLHISQAMYEGQRSYTNDGVRVWQTGRNYYPGTQRYATSIWSGDVAAQFYKGESVSWGAGLNEQKATMLSTIINGQPKWGSDGGGFNQNVGVVSNPSPELYTRWLQFASVTPVFRVHGQYNQQRQPWYFGSTAEEAVKAAIQQRYSLIPYMYSYERMAYETGLGLIRPLLFDYPEDSNVADYSDAWMFGESILVAPVTERNQSVKWIYLPAGTWIDYNRGTKYSGGQYIPYSINSEQWTDLPMFVKSGAIIPTQCVQDYVDEDDVETITVDIFPSASSTSFDYYDDDGSTYQYESGVYFSQEFSASKTNQTTSVTVAGKQGTYLPELSSYCIAVHGQAATAVSKNASDMTQYSTLNALKNAVNEGWCVGKDIYGDVTYIKTTAGSNTSFNFTVSGNTTVSATSQFFEAEDASLSGSNLDTQAATAVDHTGYSGTGFVDHLTTDGAAVTFYAKVANAGVYDTSFRYSNGSGDGKSLSIYVNGEYVGNLNMPNTDNWNTWNTVSKELELAAGKNAITVKYDDATGSSGNVNLDYMEIPFAPIQITVEAENAALWGSAKTNQNHWNYSGDGFVDGMESVGAGVEFEVIVPEDGQYSSILRFCNGTGSTKNLNLYINNTYVASVNFASDGDSWNNWKEQAQLLSLSKGRNVIAYRYESGNTGCINLDKLELSISGLRNTNPIVDNGGFERTAFDSAWTEWHPEGQELAFGVDSGSGTNPPESAKEGDNRAYFYSASAYQQSIHQGISLANGTYDIEAWVKVSNAAPTIARMEVTGHGGNAIYCNMPASGTGWMLVKAEDVSVTTGYFDIGFYCASSGGTTVHIDSVRVNRKA